ncbi:MAG: hypothetical protein IH571_05560 [Acholeplasmataceae bacterium]|nr:hypothetical protein [Acholeplasmataceae bacterium]
MKKIKFVLGFIVIFAIAAVIVGCANTASANDAYVTLDINPSVELIVTPNEKVIYANPLNEDGETLLIELNLIGMNLDDAIDTIIEEAISLGFIDVEAEEVHVEITTISKDASIGDRIRNRVKEHVNASFMNLGMKGRAEDKIFTPEFIAEANELGVSPALLRLAKAVVELHDEMTLEEALAMDMRDLMGIPIADKAESKEIAQGLREDFIADRQLLFDEYLPQIQDLEAQIELGEGDLEALNAELDALKIEFQEAVAELRETYRAETLVLRMQIRQMHQNRVEEHHQNVQQFRNLMQQRKQAMHDIIEDFQNDLP